MRIPRQFRILALIAAVVGSGAGRVQAQASPQPLTEEKIARLVALRVKGEAIASMVQAQGLAFKPDPATIARLEAAGTPAVAIDAINKAGAAGGPPPEGAVTYADLTELLGLGVPEAEILDRLKQSPTTFHPRPGSGGRADQARGLAPAPRRGRGGPGLVPAVGRDE